jgi:hypothetical protein
MARYWLEFDNLCDLLGNLETLSVAFLDRFTAQ